MADTQSVRTVITDSVWKILSEILKEVKSKVGRPSQIDDRQFLEGVLYICRTGCPWRDLPQCFGNWFTIYIRHLRWSYQGIFIKIMNKLKDNMVSEEVYDLFVDSTIVRAHPHAAGARKKHGGPEKQGLGRCKGGFTSKVHVGCIDESTTVAIVVTPGQVHDSVVFDKVMCELPEDMSVDAVGGDKGYDSDQIREDLQQAGMEPVIPGRKNRKEPIEYDKEKYKQRNQVERLINKLKQFRRVATRYEKLAITFTGMVNLAAIIIFLR